MHLVSIIEANGARRIGALDPAQNLVLDLTARLSAHAPSDCDALVADADHTLPRVREIIESAAPEHWIPCNEVKLGPPLTRPGKIMAIGLNYRDHAEEQNLTPPERPLIFAKFASAIIGPGDAIEIPPASDHIDHEVELAVVIGRRGRDIAPENARDHVFGYTVINDVTARDLQKSDRQWVRAKSFDTFCPMGPALVTVDALEFPPRRDIRLRVNGETRQTSNTSRMIFDVATLISTLSAAFTLEPGDVISTGTPSGVGVFRTPPVFLRPGDVVEAEIDGIGLLSNRVALRPAPVPSSEARKR